MGVGYIITVKSFFWRVLPKQREGLNWKDSTFPYRSPNACCTFQLSSLIHLATGYTTQIYSTKEHRFPPCPASFEQQILRNVALSLQCSPLSQYHRQLLMECFVLSTKRSSNSELSFLPVFHSVRNGVSRLLLRSGSRATLISTVVTFRE